MKKLLAIFLVLVMVLAMVSIAGAEGVKKYRFLMPNATHEFMAGAVQGAQVNLEKGAADHPDVDWQLITSADAELQNSQLDELIAEEGMDTIVLWPHDGAPLRAGAQKVIDAGINLVVFDRLIPDIDPVCEADMDNFEYGAASARFLNEFFADRLAAGETINILEFKGDLSTASTVRTDGFNATKHENIEIVQAWSTNWQRAASMDFMQSFLIDSPQDLVESIDAVFTHDGACTQGAYDALQDYKGPASLANLKAWAGMGSFEADVAITKDLMDNFGITHNLVFVSPAVTAWGVAIGYDVVSGKEVPKVVKIGYIHITLDNYQEYLDNPERLVEQDVKY